MEPPGLSESSTQNLRSVVVVYDSFQPRWKDAFAELNRAWITHYFHLEPRDEMVLSDPEGQILSLGGEIYFARLGERVVGTCALMPLGPDAWEIAKLAVDPSCQGRGIGRNLVSLCRDFALEQGARLLVARTNLKLSVSYHLLRGLGFQDLGPDPSGDYVRESLLLQYPLTADGSVAPLQARSGST